MIGIWFQFKAFVFGALEITEDPFDSNCMRIPKSMRKRGDLVNRVCNVGTSVGGDIHKHPHNRPVFPGFRERSAASITSERSRACGSTDTAAVSHGAGGEGFLDKSGLRQTECIWASLRDLDAKESADFSLVVKLESMSLGSSADAQTDNFLFQNIRVRSGEDGIINICNSHDLIFHEKAWIKV